MYMYAYRHNLPPIIPHCPPLLSHQVLWVPPHSEVTEELPKLGRDASQHLLGVHHMTPSRSQVVELYTVNTGSEGSGPPLAALDTVGIFYVPSDEPTLCNKNFFCC